MSRIASPIAAGERFGKFVAEEREAGLHQEGESLWGTRAPLVVPVRLRCSGPPQGFDRPIQPQVARVGLVSEVLSSRWGMAQAARREAGPGCPMSYLIGTYQVTLADVCARCSSREQDPADLVAQMVDEPTGDADADLATPSPSSTTLSSTRTASTQPGPGCEPRRGTSRIRVTAAGSTTWPCCEARPRDGSYIVTADIFAPWAFEHLDTSWHRPAGTVATCRATSSGRGEPSSALY